MNIISNFMKGVISKALHMTIKKKTGYDVDILINDLNVRYEEGKIRLHINTDVELEKDEFIKILKNSGLN